MLHSGIFRLGVCALTLACGVRAQSVLTWESAPGCVFADREAVYQFTAGGTENSRMAWTLSSGRMRLGDGAVTLRREGAPGQVTTRGEIRVKMPPLKELGDGVRAVLGVGQPGEPPSLTQEIWILPESPFAGRKRWLESLQIRLFDPEGAILPVLEKVGIPFEDAGRNWETLKNARGLVLIGPGVSPDDYPGLPPLLGRLAAAGGHILWLSPNAGTFPLPGSREAFWSEAAGMTMGRAGVAAEMDGRLDPAFWQATAGKDARNWRSVQPAGRDDRAMVCEILAGNAAIEQGWPWFSASWPGGGRLAICGLPLVDRWEESPVPRYFLLALCEQLTAHSRSTIPGKQGKSAP